MERNYQNNMRRILITGATGFIGRKLVPKLARNNKVICLVRKSSNLNGLKLKNVSFSYGDMLDRESVYSASKGIDMLIHLATSHSSGNEDNNLRGSINIIDSCKKNKIRKFVFVSSMATKRKNIDFYGRTKLKIENLLKKSGLNYVIIRPSIIYSENNLSLIGKSLTSIPFFIPIIGDGNYKLNPVFIDDVVKSIVASIEKINIKNREYDVAGARSLSFNRIINLCKNQLGIRKLTIHVPIFICILIFRFFPIVSIDSIKGIYEDTNADTSALEKDLNVKPISFEEGIKNVSLH